MLPQAPPRLPSNFLKIQARFLFTLSLCVSCLKIAFFGNLPGGPLLRLPSRVLQASSGSLQASPGFPFPRPGSRLPRSPPPQAAPDHTNSDPDQTRSYQTRPYPKQTRPRQTRPGHTKPDQTHIRRDKTKTISNQIKPIFEPDQDQANPHLPFTPTLPPE